jgi:hypothetical protein
LAPDGHGGRKIIEFLSMDLLLSFSFKLDQYASQSEAKDNIEAFLQFVSAKRETENTAQP